MIYWGFDHKKKFLIQISCVDFSIPTNAFGSQQFSACTNAAFNFKWNVYTFETNLAASDGLFDMTGLFSIKRPLTREQKGGILIQVVL